MGIQSRANALDKSRLVKTFSSNPRITGICSLRLNLEGIAGKEMAESSRFEFLEHFSVNTFALSGAEGNTLESLNKEGVADLLLLTTLLSICQKSCEPGFWEVVDSVSLV